MMQYTDDELIDMMIVFRTKNGRWPVLRDMEGSQYPSRSTYARRFASGYDRLDGFGIAIEMAKARTNTYVLTLPKKKRLLARIIGGVKNWLSI